MSRPARLMRTPFELNQSIACEISAKLETCQVIWFTVTSRNVAAAARGVVDRAVAQDEGMVIGAVAQEIHVGVPELPQLVAFRMVLGDVERIGDAEAEALAVEVEAGRGSGRSGRSVRAAGS